VLLDRVGIASEGEKVSTNSEGIIEVGGAKGVENRRRKGWFVGSPLQMLLLSDVGRCLSGVYIIIIIC